MTLRARVQPLLVRALSRALGLPTSCPCPITFSRYDGLIDGRASITCTICNRVYLRPVRPRERNRVLAEEATGSLGNPFPAQDARRPR